MTDLSTALSVALVHASAAMTTRDAARPLAPAMPIGQARATLAAEPSLRLAMALDVAAKLDEPPATYTAVNGEVVPLRQDPLRVSADLADEARHRLAALDAILAQRPAPNVLADWLLGLAELVERPPVGDALIAAVKALARNLNVPAACFTDASIRDVARELTWWPSFAKLEPALLRRVAPLEAQRKRLRAIIAAAAAPPAPVTPAAAETTPRSRTPEEVAHVRAIVTGFASDMADKAAGRTRAARPGRSGAVPAEYLIECYRQTIAEYERIGQPDSPFAVMARMRLAVLEARQRAGAAQSWSGDTERQSVGQRANLSLNAGNAGANPQTTV